MGNQSKINIPSSFLKRCTTRFIGGQGVEPLGSFFLLTNEVVDLELNTLPKIGPYDPVTGGFSLVLTGFLLR